LFRVDWRLVVNCIITYFARFPAAFWLV